MVAWLWNAAVGLMLVGALFFWGARLLAIESLYLDSSVILGLALFLVGLAQF